MGIWESFWKKGGRKEDTVTPKVSMGQREPSPRKWQRGDRIHGRYEVHDIKVGGMGMVYLCYDYELKQALAIKTLQDKYFSDKAFMDRFMWEAETWVRLEKHKNIVQAHYVDKIKDIPHIFLDYIVGDDRYGPDLSGWIEKKGLDFLLSLNFAIQFCSGMIHAQKKFAKMGRPFVHRDIKPGNIMVTRDRVVKVTDFGLVKAFSQLKEDIAPRPGKEEHVEKRFSFTKTGSIMGTPPYMPPEQWLGEKDIDIRADIYAFGCVLYEMLTGRPPFVCEMWYEFKAHHLKREPKPIPDIPRELNTLLLKCLKKKPEDRYDDFEELRGELCEIYYDLVGERIGFDETEKELNNHELLMKGASLDNLGYHQEAIAYFNQVINLDPNLYYAYHSRAVSHMRLSQYEEAINDYTQELKLNPSMSMADRIYYDRGYAFMKLTQFELALKDYNRAIELGITTAAVYNERGCIHAELKQFDHSVNDFEKALKLTRSIPELSSIHFNKGKVYNQSGQYYEAIESFNRVIQSNPRHANAYANRGNAYGSLGQYNRAIEDYKKAIGLHPDNPENALIYYNLGSIHFRARSFDLAFRDLKRAIELNPAYVDAYLLLGMIYGEIGQYKLALSNFDKAIGLNPNSANSYYQRGLVYAYLNKYEPAISDFSQAIKLDPNFFVAYCERGLVHQNFGNLEQAIRNFDEAIRINPKYGKAYGCRGAAYASLKQYQRAVRDYEKFIELAPQDLAEYVEQTKAVVQELKRKGY